MMRDVNRMVEILRAASESGFIDPQERDDDNHDRVYNMRDLHQMELLIDVGQITYSDDDDEDYRITLKGYDFLNALEATGTQEKFVDLIENRAVPYDVAADTVLLSAAQVSTGERITKRMIINRIQGGEQRCI